MGDVSRAFRLYKKDLTERQIDFLLLSLDIPFKSWLANLTRDLENLPEYLSSTAKENYLYIECLSGKIAYKRSLLPAISKGSDLACLGQVFELQADLQSFADSRQYIDRLVSRQLKTWINSRTIS